MILIPRLAKFQHNAARLKARRAADASRDARQFERAAEQYGAVIRTWGEDFAVLVQWGNMLKDSGAFAQAETAYDQALTLNPADADCHLQFGHLMKLTGQLDRAEEYFREARRLEPGAAHGEVELEVIEAERLLEPMVAAAVSWPPPVDKGERVSIMRSRVLGNLVSRRS